jgi:hypothetical protein
LVFTPVNVVPLLNTDSQPAREHVDFTGFTLRAACWCLTRARHEV